MVYRLSQADVDAEDLADIAPYVADNEFAWILTPGQPYRFLRALARKMRPTLAVDIGAGTGASAWALAPHCRFVHALDIIDARMPWLKPAAGYREIFATRRERKSHWNGEPPVRARPLLSPCSNVCFQQIPDSLEPGYSPVGWIPAGAYLINLDVAPHDGITEREYLAELERVEFRGILILDDIACAEYPGLRALWESIDRPKSDLTAIGHVTGTGAVFYGEDRIEIY